MKYRILHRTSYMGSAPVSVGHNQAWLTPRILPCQSRVSYEIVVTPPPTTYRSGVDVFGNSTTYFSFNSGYSHLIVTGKGEVVVNPRRPAAADSTPPWEEVVQHLREPRSAEALEAAQFVYESPRVTVSPALREYALASFRPGRPVLAALQDLTGRIHSEFEYRTQTTTISTPVDDVFRQRKGVCQDFAHLQLAMLRSLGLAGRYVSGYLRTLAPPGQPRRVGADASHAWLSAWCDEGGWIDLDPTNDLLVSEDHVTLAWGRDYSDIPPLRGVFIGGGSYQLKVEVTVEPCGESP